MQAVVQPVKASLSRQVNHWLQAATRLSALDHLASGAGWHGIDERIQKILREALQQGVGQVVDQARSLVRLLDTSADADMLHMVKRNLTTLRNQYLRVEETIHFYTEAVNSRTTPNVAALLRACDVLCVQSMKQLLQPLGKETPYVLTYVDNGIGASILKAGLRLWDGNVSRLAAVKITQHNLFRPTAIIHETGHQCAHVLNWNEELAGAFMKQLTNHPPEVRQAYASWASEIAADAFAFVHTGYASVAALHDVLSGSAQQVFMHHTNDPHPVCYVRVLMGTEMCRQFYGSGPWDELEEAFRSDYDIRKMRYPSIDLVQQCTAALPDVVRLILRDRYHAFNNNSLCKLIPPENVSPSSLQKLEYIAGPALFTSHAWIWKECIRLLALVGYRIATGEGDLTRYYRQQEEWMIRLGFTVELN